MSYNWGNLPAPESGEKREYFNLKNGRNQIRILTLPVVRFMYYVPNSKLKHIVCNTELVENGVCPIKQMGINPVERVYTNILDYSDQKVKIARFNKTTAYQISQVLSEYGGDFKNYDIVINASNVGTTSLQTAVMIPKQSFQFTQAHWDFVNKSLYDLEKILKIPTLQEINEMLGRGDGGGGNQGFSGGNPGPGFGNGPGPGFNTPGGGNVPSGGFPPPGNSGPNFGEPMGACNPSFGSMSSPSPGSNVNFESNSAGLQTDRSNLFNGQRVEPKQEPVRESSTNFKPSEETISLEEGLKRRSCFGDDNVYNPLAKVCKECELRPSCAQHVLRKYQ